MPLALIALIALVFVIVETQSAECNMPLWRYLIALACALVPRMVAYSLLVGRMLYGIVRGHPPIWRLVFHAFSLCALAGVGAAGVVMLNMTRGCRARAPDLYKASTVFIFFNWIWIAVDAPFAYFLERHWFPLWASEQSEGERKRSHSASTSATTPSGSSA